MVPGFDDTTVADLEERATIFWHCLATCDFAYFDFFFLPVECFLYYFWPVDSNNNLFDLLRFQILHEKLSQPNYNNLIGGAKGHVSVCNLYS